LGGKVNAAQSSVQQEDKHWRNSQQHKDTAADPDKPEIEVGWFSVPDGQDMADLPEEKRAEHHSCADRRQQKHAENIGDHGLMITAAMQGMDRFLLLKHGPPAGSGGRCGCTPCGERCRGTPAALSVPRSSIIQDTVPRRKKKRGILTKFWWFLIVQIFLLSSVPPSVRAAEKTPLQNANFTVFSFLFFETYGILKVAPHNLARTNCEQILLPNEAH
jgi:hypothetical protein